MPEQVIAKLKGGPLDGYSQLLDDVTDLDEAMIFEAGEGIDFGVGEWRDRLTIQKVPFPKSRSIYTTPLPFSLQDAHFKSRTLLINYYWRPE